VAVIITQLKYYAFTGFYLLFISRNSSFSDVTIVTEVTADIYLDLVSVNFLVYWACRDMEAN
jgi:hypothetical protein